MKRLVTAEEVRNVYFAGKHEICVPEDVIVTPGAQDLMYAFNIRLVRGEPAAAAEPSQCDVVARVVDSVMAGHPGDQKQKVIEAVMKQLAGRSS